MIRLGVFKTRDEHLISVLIGSQGESVLDYSNIAWVEYADSYDYNLESWAENFADSNDAEALELGEDPVVINLNSDDGIFTQIKPLSCTVNIVTKNFLSDLYTGEAQGVDILVTDRTDEIDLFYGYMTPCAYNQDYKYLSEITLEFISPLSSLENFSYLEDYTTASIQSLKYIIEKCLKRSGNYYKKYIWPDIFGKDGTSRDWRFIAITYLNEINFIEDDDEHTVKNCKEVLEEICKFLGLSLVEWMDKLYFIDYNSIQTSSRYLEYTIDKNTPTNLTLNLNSFIRKDSFYDGSVNVSYDEVYNKINCSCNLYEIDEETPSPFENLKEWSNETLDIDEVQDKQNPMDNASLQREENGIWEIYDRTYTQKSFIKYYKDGDNNKTYTWSYENGEWIAIDFLDAPIYKDTQDYQLGLMCKAVAYKSATGEILPQVSLKDYILLTSSGAGTARPTDPNSPFSNPTHKLYTYKTKFKYINSTNKLLYINFKGMYFNQARKIYLMGGYTNSNDSMQFGARFIWMQIKAGDHYLGGDFTAGWSAGYGIASTDSTAVNPTYFDQWRWVYGDANQRLRAYWDDKDKYNGKLLSLSSNITWDKGVENKSEGLVFGLPEGLTYGSDIEISFYIPHALNTSYRCDCVFISDFQVEVIESNLYSIIKQKNDDDILYTNETTNLLLNPNIVQEYDDLELIINTQQSDRKSSFSSLLNSPTEFNQSIWDEGVGNQYNIQEYNLINKYYNHYNSPKLILQANLVNRYYPYTKVRYTNLTSKPLYVNQCEYNVRDSAYDYELIEF